MKKFKQKKMEYSHRKEGDIFKAELRDATRRVIYKTKFNIKNRKALIEHLEVLEIYSGFSIIQLMKEKLKVGEWW